MGFARRCYTPVAPGEVRRIGGTSNEGLMASPTFQWQQQTVDLAAGQGLDGNDEVVAGISVFACGAEANGAEPAVRRGQR